MEKSSHRTLSRLATALLVAVVTSAVLPTSSRAQAIDPEAIYRVGISQLEEGDIENAINTFRKVLELDPRHAPSHSTLGYIYLRRENPELARASFTRALELDQDLAPAHNGLGLVLAAESRTRQQGLEEFRTAIRLDPDYLDARFNLGKVLLQMEDSSGARNYFQQVLDRDPDFGDIHYQFGLVASRQRDYETAEREFVEQYRRDATHRENRLELGRVYVLTERYDRAEEFLLPLYAQYPDYVPAMLLLGDLYLTVEDYERANQLYLQSYREFDDEETAERLWRDVTDIASDQERRTYRDTPLEGMRDFFRRFWKARDPNPTNEANERLVEHYRRLRHARQYFSSPTTPGGFDDRGRIYIRYGEPDNTVGFATGDAETKPNLTWEYHTGLKDRLIIHFVDRGAGFFEIVSSLMEASMRNPTMIYPQTDEAGNESLTSELAVDSIPIQAYRERAIIDPLYDRIANQFEELLRASSGPGGGPDTARSYQETLLRMLYDEQMEVQRDMAEALTSERYIDETATLDPLPFSFYTAAFKDIQGRTRLEVYYGIPTGELALERYGEGQTARIDLGIAVFDDQWNEIGRINEIREQRSTFEVDQGEGNVAVDLGRMLVEPGSYNFAISVTDLVSGRMGVFRDSLRIEDFNRRELSISDIEIAGRIVESRRGGPFYKEGVEIFPMPTRTFTTEQRVYIYYEVYNLTRDAFGTTSFKTIYSISPADPNRRRNILSSAWRALGSLVGLGRSETVRVELEEENGIRVQENKYLQLDFANPRPGLYQLTLEVEDLNSGQRSTQVQEFMVTPPLPGQER
jgi:GWxTD domain-containing protein